jgi:hypothetical protein
MIRYTVEQHANSNGVYFKIIDTSTTKQIGMDYFSRPVAEIAADKLNMLRG